MNQRWNNNFWNSPISPHQKVEIKTKLKNSYIYAIVFKSPKYIIL